jgi:hypothetical protein
MAQDIKIVLKEQITAVQHHLALVTTFTSPPSQKNLQAAYVSAQSLVKAVQLIATLTNITLVDPSQPAPNST